MKKILLFIFFSCLQQHAFSQSPLAMQWDCRYGGNTMDLLNTFIVTDDGGFLLAGESNSSMIGDKSSYCRGQKDYWIVKTDALGVKQWDQTFGGSNNDIPYCVKQTPDKGYIIGGSSGSLVSGDKTVTGIGLGDLWIIKTDSLGSILWQKSFSGSAGNDFGWLGLTADGGYIIGGYSSSDSSGNKSEDSRGVFDYWIIKIDSAGNQQWDKTFGGSDQEYLYCVQQTHDGGYIAGGVTYSDVSGDVTEPFFNFGFADYWIVKTDAAGNKLWDKRFGGFFNDHFVSLEQTTDDGYILGGWSDSGGGGNRTSPRKGNSDFWVVKLDASGIKQWDRGYGGTQGGLDDFGNVSQTSDGGYLMAGTSYSPISGDKSEDNLGAEQSWIIKTDPAGNREWDKTLHTALPNGQHDERGYALQTKDGCFAMANWTIADIGGDKTQSSRGTWDFWMIKYCDSTQSFLPVAAIALFAYDVCPGACTDFVNLSLNANAYQWNFPGATPDTSTAVNPVNICYASPGNYDVQLIATNVLNSDTLLLSNFVHVFPIPPPQAIVQNGDTLFANAGAVSYQWYLNGIAIAGANDVFWIAEESGNYNVVATDSNGCEVEAVIFDVIAGVQSTVPSPQLVVFPNPVTEKLEVGNLKLEKAASVDVIIYNMIGRKIFFQTIQSNTNNIKPFRTSIDVSEFPSGIYFLELKTKEKNLREKFIKQ